MSRKSPGDHSRLTARFAAAEAFRHACVGEMHVHECIRSHQAAERLDSREAGLAMEIALGAIRHANTIRSILSHVADYDDRRVDPDVRAILYTAAHQLIWLDRVPDFAAVNEAVELSREMVGVRVGGLVNAVLRRLTRAIETKRGPWERLSAKHIRVTWDQACVFNCDVLPASSALERHLAAATGEPPSRFERMVVTLGLHQAEAAAWAMQASPPITLQRNTLTTSREKFADALTDVPEIEIAGDAAYLPGNAALLDIAAFRDGLCYVQDATANQAVGSLHPRPGQRILDLCAAPGGKTIAIACAMRDQGQVVAADVSNDRLARIRANVSRLQLTSVWALLLPAGDVSKLIPLGEFDGVLADVPCSNTGVIARRPEARLTLNDKKLASLVELQQRLIRVAGARTKVGGHLVYSTCSIEPPENDAIVQNFLAGSDAWQVDELKLTLPAWGPKLSDWRDGGFVARLTRVK